MSTATTETATPAEVEAELQKISNWLDYAYNRHYDLNCDDNVDFEPAWFGQRTAEALVALLTDNPAIGATHPVLIEAWGNLAELINDLDENRDYLGEEEAAEILAELVVSCKAVEERLGKDSSWLDEIVVADTE